MLLSRTSTPCSFSESLIVPHSLPQWFSRDSRAPFCVRFLWFLAVNDSINSSLRVFPCLHMARRTPSTATLATTPPLFELLYPTPIMTILQGCGWAQGIQHSNNCFTLCTSCLLRYSVTHDSYESLISQTPRILVESRGTLAVSGLHQSQIPEYTRCGVLILSYCFLGLDFLCPESIMRSGERVP